MQKKLIALAIAGLAAAPVFAQSNVTIYGVADATIESVRAGGSSSPASDEATRLSRTRVSSNSSLLGFKGVEDLGNGLKAIYQFEGGVSTDTGLSTFSARDTYVGLSSGFGTVVLGNITHPVRAMGAKVDMTPGATGIAFSGSTYEEFLGIKTGTGDRAPNAIAYISPSFAGATVTAAYVAGERHTPSIANSKELTPRQYQIAAQYENGPIYAGLGYHDARDPIASSTVAGGLFNSVGNVPNTRLRDYRAAGKYAFGFGLTLAALWDRQNLNVDPVGAGSGNIRRDAWHLGAAYDIGPNNMFLQYSQANKVKGSLCDGVNLNCDDTKARLWTIGYNYNLSKRTMIKTYYANLRNDNNANYDFYVNPVATATTAGTLSASGLGAGADPRGFGIGLRHVF